MLESRYGDDVLRLVIASGYLRKLVNNRDIKRYLNQRHPETLTEFIAIISAMSQASAEFPGRSLEPPVSVSG